MRVTISLFLILFCHSGNGVLSKSVGQGDTCDENIDQKSDTNHKNYNAVLGITTHQRNSFVAPTWFEVSSKGKT